MALRASTTRAYGGQAGLGPLRLAATVGLLTPASRFLDSSSAFAHKKNNPARWQSANLAGYQFAMLCLDSAFPYQARVAHPWLYPRGELNAMKRRGCASCAIYRKSFPGPSWCMRSADHSSRQRRDGPSIRIGATTRSGPINSPARSLPLAARRKDGCGESESRNQGHW
jgi:hypothetical protein